MSQLIVRDKKLKKGRNFRWVKALVVVLSLYVIGVLSWELAEAGKAKGQMDQAQKKVEELRVEQDKLKQALGVVKSEAYVEQQIRDELMMAKPGETMAVVPKGGVDPGFAKASSGKQENREKDLANWQKWAQLFFY